MSDETTVKISLSSTGTESGDNYRGDFTARTILSRRQLADADALRREILGPNPEGAAARVAMDAFIAGQLAVRILKGPDWWHRSGIGGSDLPDINVLEDLYLKCIEAEKERKEGLIQAGKDAAKALKKKADAE